MSTGSAVDRSALRLGEIVGAGGQGTVWSCDQTVNGSPTVYKEYHRNARSQVDFRLLGMMPSRLTSLNPRDGATLFGLCSWPVAVVTDHGSPVGFLMRAVPTNFYCEIVVPSGKAVRKLAEVSFIINSSSYVEKRLGLSVDNQQRLKVAASLVDGLITLHRMEILVGDLSARNVLFDLDASSVFFIDCDSMSCNGSMATPRAETPLWEVQTVSSELYPSKLSDVYKVGLAVLRILSGTQDLCTPSDALSTISPSDLSQVVAAAVSRDCLRRPSLIQLKLALCDQIG